MADKAGNTPRYVKLSSITKKIISVKDQKGDRAQCVSLKQIDYFYDR